MVLNSTSMAVKQYHQQEQAKKRQSIDNSMIRFPKLDECAHFHFEYSKVGGTNVTTAGSSNNSSELNNFHVSLIINENGASRKTSSETTDCYTNIRNLYLFVRVTFENRSWHIRRNLQDFRFLDIQLHKCVFDRKYSKLQPLNLSYFSSFDSPESILQFVAQYLERLSQIVGGCFLTCGPVLHWFEIDNRGNRLINEESDINTPAIGAAFVIKKHNKNDVETEISLEIGELVSVIEMPPVNESFYWKGKKGFETGWFPAQCVQLIDDKISRKTEELPLRPLNKCISPTLLLRGHDSNSSAIEEAFNQANTNIDTHHHHYRQSVMRKHGLIAALFRSFASNNKRRDQLRSFGILKERVFGCDLCEHLANSGHDLPLVLTACCSYIEAHGLSSNGIYRLSGVASTIHRLRAIFDEDRVPADLQRVDFVALSESEDSLESTTVDIHAVSSLLKLYFRELPNPLLTFSLYDSFVAAMRDETMDENTRLHSIRTLVISLPPPHWRTLRFLTRHLSHVSKFDSKTGMTPKNLAIVWAPNLLRSRDLDQHVGIEALHVIGVQAVLTEFLILNCDKIFDREEYELHPAKTLYSPFIYNKHANSNSFVSSKCLKYIEVGPEIIPGKYHTIISFRTNPQTKRPKFNLQSLKKFHFFSTRSHNIRSRPSLFGDEEIVNGGGNFRKLTNFDGKSSSESANNFNVFHKSISNRLGVRISKSVKRSQSFDSYFKKLRASSSSCSNTKCSSDESEDGNHTMVDINRNQFDQLGKNDTIFEEEEMSIDNLEDASKFRGDSHNINEVNNNLFQISEEKPEKPENLTSVDVISTDKSLQEKDSNTDLTRQSSDDPKQLQLINDKDRLTELIIPNAQLIDHSNEQECSLEPKSSLIPATKSTPLNTSQSSSNSQLVKAGSTTDDTDTHSQMATPTQITYSNCSTNDKVPSLPHLLTAETDNSICIGSADMDKSPDVQKNEPNAFLQSASAHSSLNLALINEPSVQYLESQSSNLGNGNVQSSSSRSSSDSSSSSSSSPTPSKQQTTLSGTTLTTTLIIHDPIKVTTALPPATGDVSARELIERIKTERRNQIRQNFLQQLAQSKSTDKQLSPTSRIPVANRTSGSNLPEVSNSSDASPVRLRDKSHCFSNAAWRNSEATMNDSTLFSSSASIRQNIAECRRSVPNLDIQLLSNDSSATIRKPPFPEQTESPNKSANVKYRRPPPVLSSISVEEKTTKSAASPNRTRITVTPLSRVYNKRQRIFVDPKTLAQMFEQQKSSDDV